MERVALDSGMLLPQPPWRCLGLSLHCLASRDRCSGVRSHHRQLRNRHLAFFSESVVKGLTTEVVVASYNRNVITSLHFSVNLLNCKAERANETTVALPTRYHGATGARSCCGFGTISMHK